MVRVSDGLGLVADVLTVVLFLGAAAALAGGGDLPRAVLAAYLCALTTALLGWNTVLSGRYARRARQSGALPRLADAVDVVSHATRRLLDGGSEEAYVAAVSRALGGSEEAYVAAVSRALGHLAELYGVTTGVPCRVTLKLLYEADDRPRDLAVRTVCRSSGGPGGRSESGIDWISDNTDFSRIMARRLPYFVCNDLLAAVATGYRNSHFGDDALRRRSLPYRATIVWPVRAPADDALSPDEWVVRGFLCVDTPFAHVFHPHHDIPPGRALASALYSGVDRLSRAQNRRAR